MFGAGGITVAQWQSRRLWLLRRGVLTLRLISLPLRSFTISANQGALSTEHFLGYILWCLIVCVEACHRLCSEQLKLFRFRFSEWAIVKVVGGSCGLRNSLLVGGTIGSSALPSSVSVGARGGVD
ncbi:unnamed protein product [Brassica oleracea]